MGKGVDHAIAGTFSLPPARTHLRPTGPHRVEAAPPDSGALRHAGDFPPSKGAPAPTGPHRAVERKPRPATESPRLASCEPFGVVRAGGRPPRCRGRVQPVFPAPKISPSLGPAVAAGWLLFTRG